MVSRREFVKGAAAFGATCAIGGALVKAGVDGLQTKAMPLTFEGEPVTKSHLVADHLIARWNDLPVFVAVTTPGRLHGSTAIHGVDTAKHAIPLGDKQVLAYSAKCTHLGCTVGWASELGASLEHPDYDGDGHNDGRILCPCHQAQFDVHNLGAVVGGPASDPLPILEIEWHGEELWGTAFHS